MSRGQSAAAIILLSATIFAAAAVGIAALRMLTPFVGDSLPGAARWAACWADAPAPRSSGRRR